MVSISSYTCLRRSKILFTVSLRGIIQCNKIRLPVTCRKLGYSVRGAQSSSTSWTTDCEQLELYQQVKKAVQSENIDEVLEIMRCAKARNVVPHTKTIALAMHSCLLVNRHQDLDKLYAVMQSNYVSIGEGVRAILIRSYTARQMWEHAIAELSIEDNTQLPRHTRSFNPVIIGLAKYGHVSKAFELFERKNNIETSSKKDVGLVLNVELLNALLRACFIAPLGNVDGKDRSFGKYDTWNYKDTNDQTNLSHRLNSFDYSNEEQVELHSLGTKVFDFLNKSGNKLPSEVTAVEEWFKNDPVLSWKWRTCQINQTGFCNKCQANLRIKLAENYFQDLENEMLHVLEDPISIKERLNLSKKSHIEFVSFKEVLRSTKHHFDVIIDGQNVAFERARKAWGTHRFNYRRIKNMVAYFAAKNKTILLVLHKHSLEKDLSLNFLNSLKGLCEVYVTQTNMNDDLLLLYACAINGMENDRTSIVTGDKWRDHRHLLPQELHWKFLKWVRLNQITFKESKNGRLHFYRNFFDPVVQKSFKRWHFPRTDGTWNCAEIQTKCD
ncbi:predicted protein [Nematostella vectensis]|uniref:ribonuclease P n=1 Tax=Nematostella vectensis TaxID=45351 RepID=A7RFT7_NEMVE|nr:predicted protein [Nematostella vectensis]|eukprot:XP_001641723.1 predicted protein [Nematostella vectensis]